MSAHAVSWAWKLQLAGGAGDDSGQRVNGFVAKLVLIKLADQANDDHACWPSRSTIATETMLSPRVITRALGYLEREGLIKREERFRDDGRQTSTMYQLNVDGVVPGTTPPGPTDTHPSSQGPAVNRQGKKVGSEEPTRARAVDPVFDALLEVAGIPDGEQLTKTSRGMLNGAWKQLVDVGATPTEIHLRAHRFERRWPGKLTVPALVKRWPELAGGEGRAESQIEWARRTYRNLIDVKGWTHEDAEAYVIGQSTLTAGQAAAAIKAELQDAA